MLSENLWDCHVSGAPRSESKSYHNIVRTEKAMTKNFSILPLRHILYLVSYISYLSEDGES